MREIARDQVFVEAAENPFFEKRRIRVKMVFPPDADPVIAGYAFVTTMFGPHEVRPRAIRLDALHTDPRTVYGQPRRQGYIRTDMPYPFDVALVGHDHDTLHAVRSTSLDGVYEAACGALGRWKKTSPTAALCDACKRVL